MGCIDNSLKLIHYIGGSQWGDGFYGQQLNTTNCKFFRITVKRKILRGFLLCHNKFT